MNNMQFAAPEVRLASHMVILNVNW